MAFLAKLRKPTARKDVKPMDVEMKTMVRRAAPATSFGEWREVPITEQCPEPSMEASALIFEVDPKDVPTNIPPRLSVSAPIPEDVLVFWSRDELLELDEDDGVPSELLTEDVITADLLPVTQVLPEIVKIFEVEYQCGKQAAENEAEILALSEELAAIRDAELRAQNEATEMLADFEPVYGQ